MSIPARVWTVIYHLWSELLFAGLVVAIPSVDQVLNQPVAEKKANTLARVKTHQKIVSGI